MAGIHTRTRTRTGTGTRTRRLVLLVILAALAAAGAGLTYGALAAPATPRTPHSSTAPASRDVGSGHRLWSVFKHLWTSVGMAADSPHVGPNADGRRTPTAVSVYAAQGRDGAAGGDPRAHTGYFGSRLKEAADQR
ncbi:hypothetical protein ACFCYC_31995 [Streptomyces sp. NPDC056402]|uniref:hypothetical protein n=1 Tax=Streptomyces sp. NPDC056402 TaxID=3345810 RepID=UPI0035DF745A